MTTSGTTSTVHSSKPQESKKRRKKSNDINGNAHRSGSSNPNLALDVPPSKNGTSIRKRRKVHSITGKESITEHGTEKQQQNDSKKLNSKDTTDEVPEQDNAKLNMEKSEPEKLANDEDGRSQGLPYDDTNSYNKKSGELNQEQQERLLAAANAIMEEDMIPTFPESETLTDNGQSTTQLYTSNGVDASFDHSSIYQKYVHKKPSQVGPPELPKFNYDNIRDTDDLILETSQRANTWFLENVPENKRGKPRPFTDEEDAIVDYYLAGFCHFKKWDRNDLCNRIWTNDRTKDKFWKKVCKAIPYRTQSSIYKHIRRRYHVFDVRAKWNLEDDEKLKNLAVTHEGQWKTIGEILGRMPEDCRDRWRNYIKCGPGRTLQKWTLEEEAKLINVVNEMLHNLRNQEDKSEDATKINWTVVSERMNGTRSRIQCRYKWTQLNEKQNRIGLPKMTCETKLWLLQKITKKHAKSLEKVKWHKVMKSYARDKPDNAGWTKSELEKYLNELINQHPEKLDFQNVIQDEITKLKSSKPESR
ncbi:hypothetical protein CORT_0F01900 [Candida orthopsilosis Co 90-125]|uniref:Uncharacterized protein n=1 Tax=Candida orthopsilosis (strain 90-125) TaxID=1136231 RepID=H8X8E2_CANO9|nr:hypothetical protein CORT_0F01900 [Candida orthopsilosis Co 90-125]CCG24417.1 hypothetical protein CORT_0F01900 [Candida orthopsilosis Co 90-125]